MLKGCLLMQGIPFLEERNEYKKKESGFIYG